MACADLQGVPPCACPWLLGGGGAGEPCPWLHVHKNKMAVILIFYGGRKFVFACLRAPCPGCTQTWAYATFFLRCGREGARWWVLACKGRRRVSARGCSQVRLQ